MFRSRGVTCGRRGRRWWSRVFGRRRLRHESHRGRGFRGAREAARAARSTDLLPGGGDVAHRIARLLCTRRRLVVLLGSGFVDVEQEEREWVLVQPEAQRGDDALVASLVVRGRELGLGVGARALGRPMDRLGQILALPVVEGRADVRDLPVREAPQVAVERFLLAFPLHDVRAKRLRDDRLDDLVRVERRADARVHEVAELREHRLPVDPLETRIPVERRRRDGTTSERRA
jgi:hypothetical protein